MKSHRANLNQNQIKYLKLMYKFRFVSIPLLALHKDISQVAVKRSLKTLKEQGYIQRRFRQSYYKHNKPASFSLTKHSIKYFKDNFDLNDSILHTMYKNASAADSFVNQSLDIFQIFINIKKQYPDTFNVLTRAETIKLQNSLPSPLPNIFLSRIEPSDTLPNDYMLDIFTDVQTFVIKKRIDAFIEHFESGDWDDDKYPTLLIVCDNSRVEQLIQEYFDNARDNAFVEVDDLSLLTTTRKALLKGSVTKIWTKVCDERKELLDLGGEIPDIN